MVFVPLVPFPTIGTQEAPWGETQQFLIHDVYLLSVVVLLIVSNLLSIECIRAYTLQATKVNRPLIYTTLNTDFYYIIDLHKNQAFKYRKMPKYEKFSIYLKRAGKNSLYFYLLFSNSTITSSSWIWMQMSCKLFHFQD